MWPSVGDGRPRCVSRRRAVFPIGGEAIVGFRVDEFQAGPTTIGPLSPATAGVVSKLIDDQ